MLAKSHKTMKNTQNIKNDYTEYSNIKLGQTQYIVAKIDYQMSYIRSDEAGKFLAFLVDKDVKGAINGASDGTISIKEIIEYVEEKTGARAIIDNSGEDAPYNGEPEYSICTDKAKELGYQFTELKDWIYELLDYYIQVVEELDKVDNGRFHQIAREKICHM